MNPTYFGRPKVRAGKGEGNESIIGLCLKLERL